MIINIINIVSMLVLKPENDAIVFIDFDAPEFLEITGQLMYVPVFKSFEVIRHTH